MYVSLVSPSENPAQSQEVHVHSQQISQPLPPQGIAVAFNLDTSGFEPGSYNARYTLSTEDLEIIQDTNVSNNEALVVPVFAVTEPAANHDLELVNVQVTPQSSHNLDSMVVTANVRNNLWDLNDPANLIGYGWKVTLQNTITGEAPIDVVDTYFADATMVVGQQYTQTHIQSLVDGLSVGFYDMTVQTCSSVASGVEVAPGNNVITQVHAFEVEPPAVTGNYDLRPVDDEDFSVVLFLASNLK